ncbi:MAG: hypothetical protein IPM36_09130 [Lewinellaceae bacterium]|nr:hypothetical protein [Lewinellaceae bacterium]
MPENRDNTLTDLKANLDHFKKMVDQFHQDDERRRHTESELATIRSSLEELRKKSSNGSGQQMLQDDLATLSRQQQAMQENVSFLNRQWQAMQQALDELDNRAEWLFTRQERWRIIFSTLVAVLMLAVAVLFFRSFSIPAKASAIATKNDTANNPAYAALQPTDSISVSQNSDPEPAQLNATANQPDPAQQHSAKLLAPEKAENLIKLRSKYALTYLKQANFERLAAKYIHPEKGIHFYPAGLKAAGQALPVQSLKNAMFNPVKYDWGKVSTDAPSIKSGFIQYYKTYIYDEDFLTASSVRFNEIAFPGTFNLSAAGIAHRFPGCIFTEYRKGASSLILVFEQAAGPGVWYLVGVIHNT